MSEKLVRIYLVIIGDGYLYGGSRHPDAAHATGNQYWIGLRLDNQSFEIVQARVPESIAKKLEAQGTSDQEYSDGYVAMREARAASKEWTVLETYEGSGDEDEDGEDGDEGDKTVIKLPSKSAVAAQLKGIRNEMERGEVEEENYIDVRLQVYEDGDWVVRYGDASYDQDHRGYWGASIVSPDDDAKTLDSTAAELIDQAADAMAQDDVEIED